MRVVLVLKTCQGGLWTVPHVREMRNRGHEVIAVLPGGDGRLTSALQDLGVPVVASAFNFRFRPGLKLVRDLLRMRQQLRALRPDVLHYHLYASALATRLATIGFGVPRVHMVAGPLYLESVLIRTIERALVRLDDVTIGGSAYTSSAYQRLGVPADRTPVIPYGVDTERFSPPTVERRTEARVMLGVDAETFVAVMVAYVYAPKRLVRNGRGIKGHDVLLPAWKAFHAAHPKSKLLLIGGGFDDRGEAHRQQLIQRFELADDPSVVWLPSVTDVRPYYEASDVSVSPSLSENHGAALEAGAMGLPSIVSDAGALPETIDESCGWLVPRDEAPGLTKALNEAFQEFGTEWLAMKARYARDRVVRMFDQRRSALAVADIVEQAGAQTRRAEPAPQPVTVQRSQTTV